MHPFVSSSKLRPPGRYFGFCLGFAWLGLGCSVQAEEFGEEEIRSTTHAVVRIRHTEGAQEIVQADAMAGFVEVPAGTDPDRVIALAGLAQTFPARGECTADARGLFEEAIDPVSDATLLSGATLLAARSVALVSDEGSHELSPYAFPTVADLLRGVIYLSPDRGTKNLPAGSYYSLEGRGIEGDDGSTSELSSRHLSPEVPANVVVNDIPLRELHYLGGESRVLDVTWSPSTFEGDVVLVSLEQDGHVWMCSFTDTEAFGSVPLDMENGTALGTPGSRATLSVHRLRNSLNLAEDLEPSVMVERVLLSFDFAVETSVDFGSEPAPNFDSQ